MKETIKLTETQDSLEVIREKIMLRKYDFSKDELIHLGAVYNEIQMKATGKNKVLDSGCSSCIQSAAGIVFNYITFHESKAIEIEETIPNREIEIVIKEVSGDELEDLTLAELRELFPNIKSNSKDKFIQKVRENEQV